MKSSALASFNGREMVAGEMPGVVGVEEAQIGE